MYTRRTKCAERRYIMRNKLIISDVVLNTLSNLFTLDECATLLNTIEGYNGDNDLYKTADNADDICNNLNKHIVERFYERATLENMSDVITVCAIARHNIEAIDEITVTAHKIPSISRILTKEQKENILDIAQNLDMYDGINSIARALQSAVNIEGKTVHKEFKYVARNIHDKLTANADKATYCNKFDKSGFFKDLSNAMHIVTTRLIKYTDKTEHPYRLEDISIVLEKA